MNYVLPVCRSSFSLLYGTITPECLISTAADRGFGSLIMADFNNLYGCYDFYFAAHERGLKPIIGAELSTVPGGLLLLCENHDGFKNLSRLVTYCQLHGSPSVNELYEFRENLICLTDLTENSEKLKEVYGNNLYIRLSYDNPYRVEQLARAKKIKTAASPSISFFDKNDFRRHRLLRAINGGYLLDNLPKGECAHTDEYFRDPVQYNHLFEAFPDAVKNNRLIEERCHLVFPERKNILPDIAVDGDHAERLTNDALEGLRRRRPDFSGPYLARLEYELSVIQRTGFVDYFLIVGQIIDFCRREGIAAVGRGSAAGSLVSYSLGITEVDPIREKLYFERFLNEARSDCPDVDLDIDWRRRDDVLDFVYRTYGDDHVAMMASYIHFKPRLAIRESAKVFGHSPDEIDNYVSRLSTHPLERGDLSGAGNVTNRAEWERYRPVLEAARGIYGLPRHLGIHPGGIVITPDPMTDYVPLERATKGIVVTQCDMYQAEKIGLVKIDILGQRGLAVIADCYKEVRKISGDDFRIPENDPETYRLLRSGKTIGVFQIESPGMRAMLRDLKPEELNDITLALSLIRPGASESGMKKIFLDRFHKKTPTIYPHKNLESVLKETCGVFIYQEQVLLAGQKIAGFNLAASDLLRRAITKGRKKGDRKQLARRFLEGARQKRVDERTAQDIFAQLRQFASFGFCKAHAATYGFLAYQSAYFKAHYPGIFMSAVLQNDGGYYPSAVYVAEARRLGITVHPPDVNLSQSNDSWQLRKIFLGVGRVKEISNTTLARIEKCRPFGSLADFISKVHLSEREMENLIRVGFFDSIDTSRPRLLWQYRLLGKNKKRTDDLFGGQITTHALNSMPPLIPFSRLDVFKAEKNILELTASFHPLSLFTTYKPVRTEEIYRLENGAPLNLSGWVADRKRIKTCDGKSMVFLTFDSLDDTFEVVLFPNTYDQYAAAIRKYRYLTVEGHVNMADGNAAVIADRIFPSPTGLKEMRYV